MWTVIHVVDISHRGGFGHVYTCGIGITVDGKQLEVSQTPNANASIPTSAEKKDSAEQVGIIDERQRSNGLGVLVQYFSYDETSHTISPFAIFIERKNEQCCSVCLSER
jgi:hypothetical protein